MFCDLVGSTALSERLDPEDLRSLMQAYQQTCGVVIERYAERIDCNPVGITHQDRTSSAG